MEDNIKKQLEEIELQKEKLFEEQKYEEIIELLDKRDMILKENNGESDPFLEELRAINRKGYESLISLKKNGLKK